MEGLSRSNSSIHGNCEIAGTAMSCNEQIVHARMSTNIVIMAACVASLWVYMGLKN